jgi:uncharacterized protein YegL
MTVPLRLIKAVSPVQRGMPSRHSTPNTAVVYATAGGQLGSFGNWRPMTYREQLTSRYRTRYDVDMSDHRRRAYMQSTPLPSKGDYYFFIADVEVGFRVRDPSEIVRRNITDATKVVYSHLASEFRRITRRYDIEDSELAEAEIAARFDVEEILPDGITIFYVAPRLLPDAEASRYLQEKKEAERQVLTNLAQHKVALQEARQRGELERLSRAFEREQADIEMQKLDGRQLDAVEIIRRHLARHPDDTDKAMELFNEHRRAWLEHQDLYNKRTTELFQSMVDNDLVQAADVEALLPQMLSQIGVVPPPVPVEATLGADWAEPPVLETQGGTQEAEVLDETGSRRWTPSDGIQPVYVLVDESEAAVPDLYYLDAGLSRMIQAIAADDDVGPAIRLAVLGYADHLTVRLPLTKVTALTEPPHLAAGGAAGYAAMFELLGERIDSDLETLEEEPSAVRDPVVFLLSAGPAGDNWTKPRQRLVNPDLHRHIPTIVAFGIGAATSDLIAGIATEHGNAFMAVPGNDTATAIEHFWDFVAHDILSLGRRLVDDRALPDVPGPDGFRVAGEDD